VCMYMHAKITQIPYVGTHMCRKTQVCPADDWLTMSFLF